MNLNLISFLLVILLLSFPSSFAQRRRKTTTTTTTTTESNDYGVDYEEINSIVKNLQSTQSTPTKAEDKRLLSTTTDSSAFQPIRETKPVPEIRITREDQSQRLNSSSESESNDHLLIVVSKMQKYSSKK